MLHDVGNNRDCDVDVDHRNNTSCCQPKNRSATSLTTLILLVSVGFVQFHRFLPPYTLCSLSTAFCIAKLLLTKHSTVKEVIQSGREGHRLVYVVSQQQKAASSHDDIQFGAIGSSFRSATGFGPRTDLSSTLRCRPTAAR